jgi:Protein of unknown function (DUF2950)
MTSNESKTGTWKKFVVITGLVLVGIMIASVGILARKVESNSSATTVSQATYPSPENAAAALAQAANSGDPNALMPVLGGQAKALITTGDYASDKAAMDAFVSKYRQMNRWVDMTDGTRVLYIGADNFAFPVPLAKNSSGQWYFDGVAGAEEIRAREIGRNELLAIDACIAFASAEELYFASSNSPEYTQRIISTTGQQDGLYWPARDAQTSSPLGHLSKFPKTSLASYSPDQPFVIDGYSLRILAAQGHDAPSGAASYIVNGKMTGGFAVLATPVKYAETGIMTFMISREGMVYEQDLGPDTIKIASALQEYNPDESWSLVE